MRILVTGARGMLGGDLVEMMTGRFDVEGIDIEEADITRWDALWEAVGKRRPEFIVHCAAYTDVDGCERETDLAYRVNAVGTRNVARCCARLDIPILFVSTDFVFGGEKGSPYREYDPPDPVSEYGYTKRAGEFFVRSLHDRFYIVRTAWLYGRHGKNFIDTIRRLAREDGRRRVVHAQVGSPPDPRHTVGALVVPVWVTPRWTSRPPSSSSTRPSLAATSGSRTRPIGSSRQLPPSP